MLETTWSKEDIRILRKERYGETQIVFAKRLGVHPDSLRLYEQGRQLPSLPIQMLLDRLKEDVDSGKPRPLPGCPDPSVPETVAG